MRPLLAAEIRGRLGKVSRIQHVVADFFGIPRVQMMVPTRGVRAFSWPRQVAMYFAMQLTVLSSVEIGRQFGGRNHSTVLYACDSVRDMMSSYPDMRTELVLLRQRLAAEISGPKTPRSTLRPPPSSLA